MRRGLEVLVGPQVTYAGDDGEGEPAFAPDVTIVHPRHLSERGTEGHADLVVDVLLPGEPLSSRLRLYARARCREVWLVQLDRNVSVLTLHEGSYVQVEAEADGSVDAPSLGVVLQTVTAPDGPRLRIADGPDISDI
jgi:hypothetical protein